MKKYILIMGLMTCMCLITQSCKNEEDDMMSNPAYNFAKSFLGKTGEYPGYWMVNGVKADNCVMAYDGTVLTFSKMPIAALLKYCKDGEFEANAFADCPAFNHFEEVLNSADTQLEASPLVVLPIPIGHSGDGLYFSNAVQQKSLYNSQDGYVENYSNMYYSFSIKNREKTWFLDLLFDYQTYGVYNIEQESRVIRFYVKTVRVTPSGHNQEGIQTFDPMIELTFISNNR